MSLNVRSGQGQLPTFVFAQNLLSVPVAAISAVVSTSRPTSVTVGNVPGVLLGKFNATAQNNQVVEVLNVPGVALNALIADPDFKTRVTASVTGVAIGGNGRVHGVVAQSVVTATFPLSIHASGRYLVAANGTPFFLQGDTPWSIAAQLTNAEIDQYLADTAAKGFTAIMFNAPEKWYTSQSPEYLNRDNVAPFTSMTDYGSALTAYWNRVDYIINQAKALGIVCIVQPAYWGAQNQEGWYLEVNAESNADLQLYGQRLAQRYTQGNIIWCLGGDRNGSSTDRTKQWNIATGIRSVRTTDIMMAHPTSNTSAFAAGWDSFTGQGWSLNSAYAYPDNGANEVYVHLATEYARSPTRPVFLMESNYENEGVTTTQIRRQTYQALCSGACGQFFSNHPIWHFNSNHPLFSAAGTWQGNLSSTGRVQQSYAKALIAAYAWHKLAPSTGTALVTTSLGSGSARVTPTLASDGTFAWIYKPASGAITVSMAALSGVTSIRARFYDPSAGTYSTVSGSPFAPSGTQSITYPGERVLVLDQEPAATWTVTFSETLGYTKPYVRISAGLGSAYPTVFANTYYVNAQAAGGGTGTQGSPFNSLSQLNGLTTTGGCRVYLKGNFGLLNITSGTFSGTPSSYILFQPWPGDSTPATWTSQSTGAATTGASRMAATGWRYQIWDGGTDMLFRFNGSGSTSGQNAYGTLFNCLDVTPFRCRFNNQGASGPVVGIATGDGVSAAQVRFVNCEIYNGTYYGVYTGGGSNINTGASSHQNLEFLGCIFHDIQGYGILTEPRDGGGASAGVTIDGCVFRRVAYGTVNGTQIPNVIAPASAGGVNITGYRVTNCLAWNLGGGFLVNSYDFDPPTFPNPDAEMLCLNNTVYLFGQLTPATLNSHGYTSGADGDDMTVRNCIAHSIGAAASSGANPFNRNSGWAQSNNVSSGSIFLSTDENSPNFLKPTGSIVGTGFNVSSLLTTDYLGNTRGATNNIGAF